MSRGYGMKTEDEWKDWQFNQGASERAIRSAITSLGRPLPADYVQFLHNHDGGEGFVGDNYLILWRAEELSTFNREYEVARYAPGLFLFGSDGGGEGYGFDLRDPAMPVVRVPFIGMELRYATPVATCFTDLIAHLENRP